jgi:iron complex transport system ATP-binding protein
LVFDARRTMSSAALLQVNGLSLAAAGRELMHSLSFEVRAGQRWVVIGRNAAGKSTLLRSLAGLSVPRLSGEIKRSGNCAWLPQQSNDRFDLLVHEYLDLHQEGFADAAPVDAPDHEALHLALDMAHLLHRPITQLSGGERQRVGLAAVAHRDVSLWLLDEPVSFQDPAHQQQLAQWLCAQTQAGVVLTAHDMNWVSQVATHVIAVLADGESCGQVICGERDAVLNAEVLQRTFGCAWTCVQGRWLPA